MAAALPSFPPSGPLWVVHIGNDDRIAQRALDEGFLCIGWSEIEDLSLYDSRPAMRAAMEGAYPEMKPKSVSSSYGQPFRFAHAMQVGHPVVFPVKPTGQIAIGRVSGPYRRSSDPDLTRTDYVHVRPVEWVGTYSRTLFTQAALHSFGSFLTVSTSDDYLEEVIAVLNGTPVADADVPEPLGDEADPSEDARNLYETATQETEDVLLKAWHRTGAEFEHVVGAVFEAMGFTATVTQASGDHGVDVIAHPDPLGLEPPFIKIQVKSGTSSVGEPDVSRLRGTLNSGERGVVVALGPFTKQAEALARNNSDVTLIGAKRFVELFLDHYDRLTPEWRARYPLRQVFVPTR